MNQNKNIRKRMGGCVVCHAGNPPEHAARAVLKAGADTMEMDDNSYRVLMGNAESESAELFEGALLCCPAFTLAHRASSIGELIAHLAGDGKFVCKQDFCGPDLVLLDLDLSGAGSAFEALKWIQSQPTRLFRVVVFSSRTNERDCARAYALGADGFVTRPRSVPEMIAVLTRIEGWLKDSLIEGPDDFCAA
jgi:CheY-like chemotaxis protein